MNNILVVNINWLGDAVFTTPVFKAIKKAYPQARVACLCVPRVQELLRHCPYIDDLIVYDERGKDRWPWNKMRLIARLKAYKFDAAFLLHRSMTRALLVYLAGIPQRIGYGKAKGLLTHPVEDMAEDLHRGDHYVRVVESYGILCADRRCQLYPADADAHNLNKQLKARGINEADGLIVFNAGGNWDLKRWPLKAWTALAKKVSMQSSLKIVFSGSGKDKDHADYIIKTAGINALNLAGATGLGESLALFARARAVVSADSGPLHLANSVGADVVGIFGPTRPEITGPRGGGESMVLFKDVGCNKAPCYHLSCANNVCMQAVGVEDVWQAVQKFIR